MANITRRNTYKPLRPRKYTLSGAARSSRKVAAPKYKITFIKKTFIYNNWGDFDVRKAFEISLPASVEPIFGIVIQQITKISQVKVSPNILLNTTDAIKAFTTGVVDHMCDSYYELFIIKNNKSINTDSYNNPAVLRYEVDAETGKLFADDEPASAGKIVVNGEAKFISMTEDEINTILESYTAVCGRELSDVENENIVGAENEDGEEAVENNGAADKNYSANDEGYIPPSLEIIETEADFNIDILGHSWSISQYTPAAGLPYLPRSPGVDALFAGIANTNHASDTVTVTWNGGPTRNFSARLPRARRRFNTVVRRQYNDDA